ncbi:RloB family protein [Streptomyces silaceus]|uniref:RloB family protein n=1 Tax=Streptomyces silaceus TaxID=545123 RepID=UPI00099EDBBD
MSRRQVRGSQKISKSRGRRSENKKVLIVTEGVKTEPQYFEGLASHLNAQAVHVISVRPIGTGRDPLSVVREADRRRRREEQDGDAFDSVWCVVDVDTHATLPAACELASRHSLYIAVSSPCFEIWLLWHFEEHRAWVTAQALADKLKKHGISGKKLPSNFPYTKYPEAQARAKKCETICVNHAPPNPSSSVSELVAELEHSCKMKGHEKL